jgi:hypothetical protein
LGKGKCLGCEEKRSEGQNKTSESKPKRRGKGKPPMFVPSKISRWAKESSTNPYINNWKVGGGLKPWNK